MCEHHAWWEKPEQSRDLESTMVLIAMTISRTCMANQALGYAAYGKIDDKDATIVNATSSSFSGSR